MTKKNNDYQKSFDIRSVRLSKGIKQSDFANLVGISINELSKYERGLVFPREDFFIRVSKLLKLSQKDLENAHTKLIRKKEIGEGYVTATSDQESIIPRRNQPDRNKIPVLDLFCGSGGFSHGFELTNAFEVTVGLDLLWDRINTFSYNHPAATAFCKDVRNLKIKSLLNTGSKPKVVIGGPPCQGFSSIRPFRSLTEEDARNNLFEYFACVLKVSKPDWFVMENVVGLLTHNNGASFKTILDTFNDLGYSTDWRLLNAVYYGLPQRRERLIIVGNSEGKTFIFPEPTHYLNGNTRSMAGKKYGQNVAQKTLFQNDLHPCLTVMDAIHDLPEIDAGESSDVYPKNVNLTSYEKMMRGNERKLTLHQATKHSPHMLEIIRNSGFNRSALPAGLTTSGFSTCYSRLEPDRPSVTITVNFVHPSSNKCIHPVQNRALTPREGARLQGFEDGYKFYGTRAQIVKQIGNAVPPLFGKVIANAILVQMAL